MPKNRNDGVLIGVMDAFTDDGVARNVEYVYEVMLGMEQVRRNGVVLPITISLEGSFVIISTSLPDVEHQIVLPLKVRSMEVKFENVRLGIITRVITANDDYYAVWEAANKQLMQVPTNGFPQHTLGLIGAFLFWKHLLRKDMTEQPTH